MDGWNSPKWWYWTTPSTSRLKNAFEQFFSPDVFIWPEDSEGEPARFAWGSPHFDDAASGQDLVDRSAALKAVFDGAMYLVHGANYQPPALRDLDSDDGSSRFAFDASGEPDVRAEPFSARCISAKADLMRDPLGHPVGRLIFLARYDDVTKDVLKYVGVNGLTYTSLYALTDWMTQAPGWDAKRIAREAGLSNSRYGDFTATANNPAYLGPFCRHGGVSRPPRRPMPLADAQEPVAKAALAFLEERGRSFDLQKKWDDLV